MHKCLTVSFVLLMLLFQINGIAFAAEAAGVDIRVTIGGGGTAYMIPEDNSPMPTEKSIQVDNGRTGRFHIDFTEAGEFLYTIRAVFSADDGERPAKDTFRLTVTVRARADGSLYTVSVIHNAQTAEKEDAVRFEEKTESTTGPSATPDEPAEPGIPGSPPKETTTRPYTPDTPYPPDTPNTPNTPGTPGKPGTPDNPESPGSGGVLRSFLTPKTGDESHLTDYLLIAVASSAGLFCLALLYTWNTKRLIRNK